MVHGYNRHIPDFKQLPMAVSNGILLSANPFQRYISQGHHGFWPDYRQFTVQPGAAQGNLPGRGAVSSAAVGGGPAPDNVGDIDVLPGKPRQGKVTA